MVKRSNETMSSNLEVRELNAGEKIAKPGCSSTGWQMRDLPTVESVNANHPIFNGGAIWRKSVGDYSDVVILAGGASDPILTDGGYDDLGVYHECIGDYAQQQQEAIVINDIGAALDAYMQTHTLDEAIVSADGYSPGFTYGAIFRNNVAGG